MRSRLRFAIVKPEDKKLKREWDKLLAEKGVGQLAAERVYVELPGRVKERDNKWRAGEEAEERHLISEATWQTEAPEWANNNTSVLRVRRHVFHT